MNLLITGGVGFIGTNFIKYIAATHPDYQIINLDLLTYASSQEALSDLSYTPNYKFIQGDISDRNFIRNLFKKEKVDTVVNFAAESHVDRSIADPGIFIKTNITRTQILLDAALEYGVKRFHQISTDEVYGDFPLEEMAAGFTEESPLQPSNPYSASKASADLLVLSYFRTYKQNITISRCSNNYGPYQNNEKLIPLILSKAAKNQKIPVYGDGRQMRDWIYVTGHCRAIERILLDGNPGQIYNISAQNEIENIELIKKILKKLEKPDTLIEHVDDRPGHDKRYVISTQKIHDQLKWNPQYTFEAALDKTISWYITGD